MSIKLVPALLSAMLFVSSSPVLAMGERAEIFETAKPAAIWSHAGAFYLRADFESLVDLKDQSFVWAGFQEAGAGLFQGELVANDFAPTERRFPARAKLLGNAGDSSFYLVEVLDDQGAPIKEFVLKGPAYQAGSGVLKR